MESARSQRSGPVLPRVGFGFQRSLDPCSTGRHRPYSSHSSPPPVASASAFSFNSLIAGSLSPTWSMNLRSVSPSTNLKSNKNNNVNVVVPRIKPKTTCMCSPTNHPGSFRCNLHRNKIVNSSPSPNGGFMDARRSAMANSLVRICSVEGDFMIKRALSSLVRPSSHQLGRRSAFHPTPSRLSHMTNANEPLVPWITPSH